MCSKDAANVKMTQSLQKLILDLHNNMRNKVAKGELSGYEPATRMGYLVSTLIFSQNKTIDVKQV